jgi:ATP-dependent RNA circularization protein (DNA/RNA ligase family)
MNGFIEYPKMKTLYKLIPCGKKWDCTSGEILADTAALHFLPLEELVFKEKIDGGCMHLLIKDHEIVNVQKRTKICDIEDKSDRFYFEIADSLRDKDYSCVPDCIIYGELCGEKIQVGGNYFKGRRFLMFDVLDLNTGKFFTQAGIDFVAETTGIEKVPTVNYTGKSLQVDEVKEFVLNLKSFYNPEFNAEGMVIRHLKDTSYVKRWIAKIRRSDFKI